MGAPSSRVLIGALALMVAPAAGQEAQGTPDVQVAPMPRFASEAPVTGGITTGTVSIAPLGPPGASSGVLPSSVTGLSDDLWTGSDADDLASRIAALPDEMPRAALALERVMMLAEADPPLRGDPEALLAARLVRLLDRGHLDAAAALASRTGGRSAVLRRIAFDIALLLGDETEACGLTDPEAEAPGDYARRVFCLVRAGDFAAASTVFDSARALGRLDPQDEVLLELFLFPELLEELSVPVPPRAPTPLQFRLNEALGEPMPTRNLPVAFARSDLRPIVGRKAQIEAAERLARAGALEGTRLLQLYTSGRPSASGGVWDRAAALRDLDAAFAARNPEAVALALPRAVEALDGADLTAALADAIYPQVAALRPQGVAAQSAALRLGLLSADYEAASNEWSQAEGPHLDAARSVARGEPPSDGGDALDAAVGDAFAAEAPVPDRLGVAAEGGRLGEALLIALDDLSVGAGGDRARLAGALAFLRSVGLEDTARRVGIEVLISREAA